MYVSQQREERRESGQLIYMLTRWLLSAVGWAYSQISAHLHRFSDHQSLPMLTLRIYAHYCYKDANVFTYIVW